MGHEPLLFFSVSMFKKWIVLFQAFSLQTNPGYRLSVIYIRSHAKNNIIIFLTFLVLQYKIDMLEYSQQHETRSWWLSTQQTTKNCSLKTKYKQAHTKGMGVK